MSDHEFTNILLIVLIFTSSAMSGLSQGHLWVLVIVLALIALMRIGHRGD